MLVFKNIPFSVNLSVVLYDSVDSKLTVSPMSLVYKPVEGIGVNLFLVHLISRKFSLTIY